MQIVIIPTLISNNPKFETSPHGPKYQVSKANCALNSVRLYRETSSLLFVSFCLFVCFHLQCKNLYLFWKTTAYSTGSSFRPVGVGGLILPPVTVADSPAS